MGQAEPSVIAHLVKRVLVEKQWADDVTVDEYLAHLHGVVRQPDLRVAVYRGRDRRVFLGLLSPNRIPNNRLGERYAAFLWVVYAADYGKIVTG